MRSILSPALNRLAILFTVFIESCIYLIGYIIASQLDLTFKDFRSFQINKQALKILVVQTHILDEHFLIRSSSL